MSTLLDQFGRPLPAKPAKTYVERLSAREREVLRLVAHGLSNEEIAAELRLSHKTIDAYLQFLRAKLRVREREELIRIGQRARLPG